MINAKSLNFITNTLKFLLHLNKSKDLKQKMADVNLKDPFVTGSPAESKLKQYEKAFGGLKNSVLTQDKQICNKQTSKLKEFIRQINQTKSKVHASKGQCQTKTIKLKQEIDFLERKLQGFQIGARTLQLEAKIKSKIAQQEKAYINNCQKRVQIAESIYYQKFKKLEIDQRKSQANEVFRWILVAVYVEPENKFYWPNFLEQIFENKQGCLDLKQRLGKFNAYNAKQQQRVKTRSFIDAYEKIKLSPEFAPHNIGAEVQKIYQIAKIFLNCSDIGKQIKEYEKQIQKGRQANSKEDETLVQSRKECDALIEKYRLSELYLDQLTKIELSLTNKIQLYNREVELAETYLAELTNITDSKIMVSHESQKREHCECSIF